MRIILTPIGKELIKKFNQEKQTKSNPEETLKRKSKSPENTKIKQNNSPSVKSTKHKSYLLNKLLMDQTTISLDELKQAKEITLKQKKLNFPKNVSENYNIDTSSKISAAKILPGPFMKSLVEGTLKTVTDRFNLTMRDVLNSTAVTNMKSKILNDQRMRNKLSRVDELNFRTTYNAKNYKDKIEEKLSHIINPDRINLIKYLNEKEVVTEVLIKKISEYDEEKINKINKICQIVFHDEERSRLNKEIIRDKLEAKRNREKIEFKSNIDNLGRTIEGFNSLFKTYEKKVCDKDRYKEVHTDIVKYWGRIGIDKISKQKNTKSNFNTSSPNQSNLFQNNYNPQPQNDNFTKLVITTDSTN